MLSTIRTILAFNKNLTLGLPSALTWVILYNHEGPCGVILFSLEMMIIKKHLLSDFSSIWLSLPLWSLLPSGCATGFSVFFCVCYWWIPLFFWWITAHSSPAFIYCWIWLPEVYLWQREAAQPTVQCVILLMFLLAQGKFMAVSHLSLPMLWDLSTNTCLETTG